MTIARTPQQRCLEGKGIVPERRRRGGCPSMMFLASFCVFVVFPFFVPSSSAHFVHFFQKMRIFAIFCAYSRIFFGGWAGPFPHCTIRVQRRSQIVCCFQKHRTGQRHVGRSFHISKHQPPISTQNICQWSHLSGVAASPLGDAAGHAGQDGRHRLQLLLVLLHAPHRLLRERHRPMARPGG